MTPKSRRLYISLTPQALNEPAIGSEFVVIPDEAFMESRGLDSNQEPRGEVLEILEDEALYLAATASLMKQNATESPRRVVAVAELIEGFEALPDSQPGSYRLTRPLQFSEVVSYHVDEPAAAPQLVEYLQNINGIKFPQESLPLEEPRTEVGSLSMVGSQPNDDLSLPNLLWFDASELDLVRHFLLGRP